MEVHSHIEKFLEAKSWEIVDLESTGSQITRLNVGVTFERRDTPAAEWTFGNDFTARYMGILILHRSFFLVRDEITGAVHLRMEHSKLTIGEHSLG